MPALPECGPLQTVRLMLLVSCNPCPAEHCRGTAYRIGCRPERCDTAWHGYKGWQCILLLPAQEAMGSVLVSGSHDSACMQDHQAEAAMGSAGPLPAGGPGPEHCAWCLSRCSPGNRRRRTSLPIFPSRCSRPGLPSVHDPTCERAATPAHCHCRACSAAHGNLRQPPRRLQPRHDGSRGCAAGGAAPQLQWRLGCRLALKMYTCMHVVHRSKQARGLKS
jgi:hypothetical protein